MKTKRKIKEHLKLRDIRVEVIQKWIYIASYDRPGVPGHCSIANRISESGPDIFHVHVDSDDIAFSVWTEDLRYYYHTPPEAVKFVTLLDEGKDPGTFMLVLRQEDLDFAVRMMHYVPGTAGAHAEPYIPTTYGPRTR